MRLSSLVATTLALALAGSATAADNLLSYAPADTEIVIGINIRKVADTPFVQKIIKEKGGEKAEAQLAILQGVVGVNLMKDLDRAWLWGKPDNDDSIGVMVEGRINQQALLNLLKANEEYSSTEVDGATVHVWKDDKEKRMKYGVFVPEGAAAVFNTKDALAAALAAKKAGNGFLAGPKAKQLPAGWEDAAAFALILKPEGKDGKFKDTLRAEAANGTLRIDGETLAVAVTAVADSSEAAKSWLEVATGFVALLKLQGGNEGLRTLADRAKVEADEAARSVKLSVSATVTELGEWAKQGHTK